MIEDRRGRMGGANSLRHYLFKHEPSHWHAAELHFSVTTCGQVRGCGACNTENLPTQGSFAPVPQGSHRTAENRRRTGCPVLRDNAESAAVMAGGRSSSLGNSQAKPKSSASICVFGISKSAYAGDIPTSFPRGPGKTELRLLPPPDRGPILTSACMTSPRSKNPAPPAEELAAGMSQLKDSR